RALRPRSLALRRPLVGDRGAAPRLLLRRAGGWRQSRAVQTRPRLVGSQGQRLSRGLGDTLLRFSGHYVYVLPSTSFAFCRTHHLHFADAGTRDRPEVGARSAASGASRLASRAVARTAPERQDDVGPLVNGRDGFRLLHVRRRRD